MVSISTAPIVKVYTVIKPSGSGPGPALSQPPQSYQNCIPELLAPKFDNQVDLVHLLGYVDTQDGKRNLNDVVTDIETYAGWAEGYRPEGIYLDHVLAKVGKVGLYNQYAGVVREQFGNTSLSTHIGPETPANKQIVVLYNATGVLESFPTVDQISAIADVKACFITNEPEENEYDSVPSIWSQLLGSLIVDAECVPYQPLKLRDVGTRWIIANGHRAYQWEMETSYSFPRLSESTTSVQHLAPSNLNVELSVNQLHFIYTPKEEGLLTGP
ncbi:hypothetical protein D9757_012073 [Collybiopsis confluens]|uniref:Uncharacterized protein n=1 Tax=Collybiopsis confluens TaxID=2823264 RepID=A0A8H5LLI2_9AGAR|nr:hypothetical protein D9757_012073 [Collybiopsis confluens]